MTMMSPGTIKVTTGTLVGFHKREPGNPNAPCMEYLPTFAILINQMHIIFHTWSIWGIQSGPKKPIVSTVITPLIGMK